MAYWLVLTEASSAVPPGTRKVVERVPVSETLVRWLVEGAGFMSVLPTVVKGVHSVEPVRLDNLESAELVNRW